MDILMYAVTALLLALMRTTIATSLPNDVKCVLEHGIAVGEELRVHKKGMRVLICEGTNSTMESLIVSSTAVPHSLEIVTQAGKRSCRTEFVNDDVCIRFVVIVHWDSALNGTNLKLYIERSSALEVFILTTIIIDDFECFKEPALVPTQEPGCNGDDPSVTCTAYLFDGTKTDLRELATFAIENIAIVRCSLPPNDTLMLKINEEKFTTAELVTNQSLIIVDQSGETYFLIFPKDSLNGSTLTIHGFPNVYCVQTIITTVNCFESTGSTISTEYFTTSVGKSLQINISLLLIMFIFLHLTYTCS